MHLNRTLATTLALTVVLGTACSDATLVEPSALDVASSASAAPAPYAVDQSLIQVAIGGTYQLSASNVANGKTVPDSSVTWVSADPSIATVSSTGRVTAVTTGTTTVAAVRGVHRVETTVVVIPCAVTPLAAGTTEGAIANGDCGYAFGAGRLADYYSVVTAPAEVVEFVATGLAGSLGFKEATANPLDGAFYGAVGAGVRMRVISNGGTLQPFFAGAAGAVGSYTISRTTPAEPYRCGSAHVFRPGVAFTAPLTPDNSCKPTVQFPIIPEAYGKQLNTHYYNMYAQGGTSYTVTIAGVSDTFNPSLTVFANGGVIGQSGPDGNAAPATRTITFSRATDGYVGIEVATGRFIGGLEPENWVIESGAYTMTVSQ